MIGFAYPEISPIMFSIGPVAVRWYSMAYLIGIVVGWWLINRNVRLNNLVISKAQVEDLIFYLTLGIIIGGRLGYAMFYGGAEMWVRPWRILELWKGGMSFHGGVVGVVVAIWLFSKKIKYNFLALTDLVVLYAPIGIFLGRVANFINDELWGRVTNVSWAVRFPSGGYLPRHPSQIYEGIMEGVLMFIILNILWKIPSVRKKHGIVSSLFVMMYGIFRILLEQYREPDAQLGYFFGGITMGQMLSLPLIITGLLILFSKIFYSTPEK
ncbi:MAG: prolipoprotein diacylglyceryl transferase [Alphaproteobacteria bacterium]|nr:prolipoprotein diacylglyceryl transferase [Alphaproteobacteria bacterium]